MWDKIHNPQTIMIMEEIHETFISKLADFWSSWKRASFSNLEIHIVANAHAYAWNNLRHQKTYSIDSWAS